jgi:hypothetical protein
MSLPFNISPKKDKTNRYFNSICEALTCSFYTAEKIKVKVGIRGIMPLILYSKCINIFQKQERNDD